MEKQCDWEISVEELAALRRENAAFQLIDVREPHEYEICNLGGQLIPLSQLGDHIDRLDREGRVVVHCRSGARSAKAVNSLRAAGFDNVWNVNGGILAWIERVDPELTRY
ncbi:MAG TPA: rhodanese-like domain-containing protein [Myxococcota bacterium]